MTLNTHGMAQNVRAQQITEYLQIHNIDLAFLQETNMTSEKQNSNHFWDTLSYKYYFFSTAHRFTGVGVAVNKRSTVKIKCCTELITGYLLYTEFDFNGTTYHAYNIYMPQEDATAYTVIKKLQQHSEDKQNNTTFLVGDFNVTLNPILDRQVGEKNKSTK